MIQLNFSLRLSRLHRTAAMRAAITVLSGVVICASPTLYAQQYSVLHSFTGGADGSIPLGGMAIDATGTIYGVTNGELGSHGTVYRLNPHNGGFVLNTLYTFTGGNDGSTPVTVIIGPDGALYGSTGGGGQSGLGVIFRLQPPPTFCATVSCPWTETVLYNFMPGGIDAAYPAGQLAFDASGALYGTGESGGGDLTCGPNLGCGAIFKLTRSGNQWTESVLYGFQQNGVAGYLPLSGVTLDASGNLYGTTAAGGPNTGCTNGYGCGTAYELTASGSIKALYGFNGSTSGGKPLAGLTFDHSGNLLGATFEGGSQLGGTVFELSPAGNNWNFNLVYSLYSNGGYGPFWNLTMDPAGNFYGTTSTDGPAQAGNVFQLTPTDGGWQYNDIHNFQQDNNGWDPEGGVVVDAAGNVYGTTAFGGSDSRGTIWEITP